MITTLTNKLSTIFYTNLNNKGESLVLPTIQSINVQDTTSIPSKPTITGEYRNQYVVSSPVKVTFVVWLEPGDYGGEQLDVSETLDHLLYLKKNRIPFNLITSHTEEESRFFNNLVIENIPQTRDAQHRNRLICTINCVQIWLVNLTWSLASAVEIFGHEIFTDTDTTIEVQNKDFTGANTNEDFELSDNKVTELFKKLGEISGYTDMPVNRLIRNEIEKDVPLDKNSFYFKLTDLIDMSVGSKIYKCACQFKSRYAIGDDEEPYNVNLGQFTLDVTKKDGILEQNYLFVQAQGSSTYTTNHNLPMARYPYDTADTYKDYTIQPSFEHIENFNSLYEYLVTKKNNGYFTEDVNAMSSGSVVVKNGYVWTYKISNHYTFDVSYGSFKKTLIPDGALKIDTFKIMPKDGFKITVSNEKRQTDWNSLAESGISLVVVSLGSWVQLYLFSPTIFNRTKVYSNT